MKTETSNDGKYRIFNADAANQVGRIRSKSVNLIVSSPPYNIGKSYEQTDRLSQNEYKDRYASLCSQLVETLADNGSICWQVGNHVRNGIVTPLDYVFYEIFCDLGLQLRNRIIWKYNFGLNCDRRFSGRHETILWFTKSNSYTFNLDPVRVPQLYPGKRHSSKKGAKAGLLSGNPLGKNPSDVWEFDAKEAFFDEPVWDIPNVKANHPEKTPHPCQFPISLVERCVLALTHKGDYVLDPFMGAGSSLLAALRHGRNAIGIEREQEYCTLARTRIKQLKRGELPYRDIAKSTRRPKPTEKVSQFPNEWLNG